MDTLIEYIAIFIATLSWVLFAGSFLMMVDKKEKRKKGALDLFIIAGVITIICLMIIYYF